VIDTQAKCWNLACLAADWDGIRRVDVTGRLSRRRLPGLLSSQLATATAVPRRD
jgi:hypothetical protein